LHSVLNYIIEKNKPDYNLAIICPKKADEIDKFELEDVPKTRNSNC